MSVFDDSASVGNSTIDPIAALIKSPFTTTVDNFAARPNDFPGGFVITEYIDGVPQNGINGATNTVIRLTGNLMPFQPISWGGEQRLAKEYYPGNNEPSVQVLGAKEDNIVIKGRFKDKRYKDPSYYGISKQFADACDAIRKRGNLLKFGMHGNSGELLRYGWLEKSDFKMKKLSWVDYELTFFVVSDKQPINNYFAAPEKTAPSTTNQQLLNSASLFAQSYSSVPKTMPLSISGAINNLISGIAKNINLVTNFVGAIVSTAQSIEDSANRALGLIKNCRASIHSFQVQIDNISGGHAFNTLSTEGSAPSRVRSTYQNLQYIFETQAATRQIAAYLAQMQAQFQALAQTVPKARYKVISGDTLQNISIKFYGTADNWTDIYDHNQLQSTDLSAGTWTGKPLLEIPNV
jgi:nucleoid-associated protein YgaU